MTSCHVMFISWGCLCDLHLGYLNTLSGKCFMNSVLGDKPFHHLYINEDSFLNTTGDDKGQRPLHFISLSFYLSCKRHTYSRKVLKEVPLPGQLENGRPW